VTCRGIAGKALPETPSRDVPLLRGPESRWPLHFPTCSGRHSGTRSRSSSAPAYRRRPQMLSLSPCSTRTTGFACGVTSCQSSRVRAGTANSVRAMLTNRKWQQIRVCYPSHSNDLGNLWLRLRRSKTESDPRGFGHSLVPRGVPRPRNDSACSTPNRLKQPRFCS
jgi:hypothetical protein